MLIAPSKARRCKHIVISKHGEAKQIRTTSCKREDTLAEVHFCKLEAFHFMSPALTNPAPTLPSPHLQAGYNEVHSFFWCKDFKEAITRYQNEPGNQAETGSKPESLAPQPQQNPSKLFYEYPRSNRKGRCHKSHLEIPRKHQKSSGAPEPTIHRAEAIQSTGQRVRQTMQDLDQDILTVLLTLHR